MRLLIAPALPRQPWDTFSDSSAIFPSTQESTRSTPSLSMSSNECTTSSSSSLEESALSQPDHRARVGSSGSKASQPYEIEQAERSWPNSNNQPRPSEDTQAGPSRRAGHVSAVEQEWRDHVGDNTTLMDGTWAEQSRGNHTSADRKRRLTNSAHNSGRVRTVTGGFHSRNQSSSGSQHDGHSRTNLPQTQWPGLSTHNSSLTEHREPTARAPPPIRRHSSKMHCSTNTTPQFILPRWQPDSEVSECPICSRQFTFWFRKHHCRKCGRVVCASCSPHRITIPRQYIVHPPGSTNRISTVAASNPAVIDLTGEAGSSARPDISPSCTSPRSVSNPGLGGGEEVRLCNPCVPDPQPSPVASLDLAEFLRQGRSQADIESSVERSHPFRSSYVIPNRVPSQGQQSPSDEARELRRQRGRGMIVSVHLNPYFQSYQLMITVSA